MKDNSLNEEMNSQLQDMKPCFYVSNSKLFVNLHIAASKKAAEKMKMNPKDNNINQFIINTGMSEDGRYMSNKIGASDSDDVGAAEDASKLKKFFRLSGNKYEVGIVVQFTEFKSPTHQDIKDNNNDVWQAIWNVNKQEEKKLRSFIYNGINEYFQWFSGIKIGSPDDLIPFVPDYDGGRIQLDGGVIRSMDKERIISYLMNRVKKEEDKDDEAGEHFVPRFGYKIGYTITY